jgi:hypothetical protein
MGVLDRSAGGLFLTGDLTRGRLMGLRLVDFLLFRIERRIRTGGWWSVSGADVCSLLGLEKNAAVDRVARTGTLVFVLVFACREGGFRVGRNRRRALPSEVSSSISSHVAATPGTSTGTKVEETRYYKDRRQELLRRSWRKVVIEKASGVYGMH